MHPLQHNGVKNSETEMCKVDVVSFIKRTWKILPLKIG